MDPRYSRHILFPLKHITKSYGFLSPHIGVADSGLLELETVLLGE